MKVEILQKRHLLREFMVNIFVYIHYMKKMESITILKVAIDNMLGVCLQRIFDS